MLYRVVAVPLLKFAVQYQMQLYMYLHSTEIKTLESKAHFALKRQDGARMESGSNALEAVDSDGWSS